MKKQLITLAALGAIAATLAAPAHGQNVGRAFEFGIDATAEFGLGDADFTRISLPARRARIGYEFSNRASFEPFAGFSYIKVNDASTTNLEVGAGLLFYLTGGATPGAPSRMATTVSRIYLRPYAMLEYANLSPGGSNTDFGFGAGLGLRQALGSSRFATRWEVNVQHVAGDTDATSIGMSLGLSFFMR